MSYFAVYATFPHDLDYSELPFLDGKQSFFFTRKKYLKIVTKALLQVIFSK